MRPSCRRLVPRVLALAALAALVLPLLPALGDETRFALEPRDLEVLPVHDREWVLLARDHPEPVAALAALAAHVEKVHGHLAAREDPTDAAGRALVQDIERTVARMAEPFDALRGDLARLGVDAAVLAEARRAPTGALRPLRHALRLVERVPGQDARARALHARLVPAVEGALLVLRDDTERARTIETRFWRVVDATIDREGRAWLRRRLPNEIAKVPDMLGHVFVLPGLEPSQVQRLRALLVELEAAGAPDEAIVARAAKAASPAAQREKAAAEQRSIHRLAEAWERGLAILEPEQRAELRSLPPRLTAQQRGEDLKPVLETVSLTPDQQDRARALALRYGPVKGRLVERLAMVEMRAKDASPDGVAREAAEAERLGAYAEALVGARRAATEVFRDLLEPDQVLEWVLR